MTLQKHVSDFLNQEVTPAQARQFAEENFNLLCSSIRDQQQEVGTPINHKIADKAVDNMRRHGGGFVCSLADLYNRADLSNRKKLYNTFYNEFEKYSKM